MSGGNGSFHVSVQIWHSDGVTSLPRRERTAELKFLVEILPNSPEQWKNPGYLLYIGVEILPILRGDYDKPFLYKGPY